MNVLEYTTTQLLPIARDVVAAAQITPGERIVDLGCRNGDASVQAAELGATVVGIDLSQEMLDFTRARAQEHELDVRLVAGDAAAIPYCDGCADALVSVFGMTFVADPVAAAAEMARVVSDRGRIVLSAWILDDAPVAWHDRDVLAALLGPHGFTVEVEEHEGYVVATASRG
jgi:ubiquinone/menaquinone biosynthesis C-methylase UbiE